MNEQKFKLAVIDEDSIQIYGTGNQTVEECLLEYFYNNDIDIDLIFSNHMLGIALALQNKFVFMESENHSYSDMNIYFPANYSLKCIEDGLFVSSYMNDKMNINVTYDIKKKNDSLACKTVHSKNEQLDDVITKYYKKELKQEIEDIKIKKLSKKNY